MKAAPKLLNNDATVLLPRDLFSDLQLDKILSEQAVSVLQKPCGQSEIVHRNELFSMIDKEENLVQIEILLSTLFATEKALHLLKDAKIALDKYHRYAEVLSLYANSCQCLASMHNFGDLFADVAKYFSSDEKQRCYVEIKKSVQKINALLEHLHIGLLSFADKIWLTPNYDAVSEADTIALLAESLGFTVPKKKAQNTKINLSLSDAICRLYAAEVAQIESEISKFASVDFYEPTEYIPEIKFFLEIHGLIQKVKNIGVPHCIAKISKEPKDAYEATFEDENGELPDKIASSALNEWIFNEDTIKEVLHVLMTDGLKIDYGQKLGKTVIFAKNHTHAEKILEIFNKQYPHLPGFAKVIDNYMTYAQSAIDEFSDPEKLPQIAISVDMLDTGIDVPEILNLVFFKKVMSKAKFWQMIGRGTRRCDNLMDGKDKDKFYIFDFCGNFEFFRMNNGKPTANMIALQGAIFHLKAQIAFKLQDLAYQTDELIAFRKSLVEDMVRKVRELNKEHFAVRQHLKYVELYSSEDHYKALSYEDTLLMGQELAPLIVPDEDDAKAVRFDALIYVIELAYLAGKKYGKARSDLYKKVSGIASVANIPEIMAQADLINQILHTDYLDNAGIKEFEYVRENLRDLIKYIPVKKLRYDTNFDDEILSVDWKESELENDDLKNYKAKAEFYIRQHLDNEVISKLKSNIPLDENDIKALEKILWNDLGTKEDYEAEYGAKPLGEFVREIIGLDMNAAKAAFAEFLNDTNLDERQIYFVNQIVEYIVHNGVMTDISVLQEPPFTDYGSVVEVFTDLSVWTGIRKAIDSVNANAMVA